MSMTSRKNKQPMPITTEQSQDVTPALLEDIRQHGSLRSIPGIITSSICADIERRAAAGLKTYKRPLQTHNGRNATQDALEECTDLAQYCKQRVMEDPTNGHYRVALWNAITMVFMLKQDMP